MVVVGAVTASLVAAAVAALARQAAAATRGLDHEF
jgi:hypothetical protein